MREQLVAEARDWLPTPYVDHAGIKHVGVDCAFYLLRIWQAVGLAPLDFKVPKYDPQQWINSPCQRDKRQLKFEDTTFLDIVKRLTKREISEAEVLPGDLVLWKVAASWTHGAIVVRWPDYVLHAVKLLGVSGAHGTEEGFWKGRERRYFSAF